MDKIDELNYKITINKEIIKGLKKVIDNELHILDLLFVFDKNTKKMENELRNESLRIRKIELLKNKDEK